MFAKDQVGPDLPCRDPHWTSKQSMERLLLQVPEVAPSKRSEKMQSGLPHGNEEIRPLRHGQEVHDSQFRRKEETTMSLPSPDSHDREWEGIHLLDDVSTLQRHEERVQVREESCKNASDADVPTKREQESSSGFQV